MRPIRSFEAALNLSYLSVFHNNDEGDKNQANFKIFNKVIKLEMLMRTARGEDMVRASPPPGDLGAHEFSRNAVLSNGEALGKYFDVTRGDRFRYLESTCLHALRSRTLSEFATTKASACTMKLDEFSPSERQNKRDKALIEVLKFCKLHGKELKESDSIMLNLDMLLKLAEDRDGLRVNLFKKNQHGGTREIFVLEMIGRIVVNILETMGRAICEETPGEMLTKGKEKLKTVDQHYHTTKELNGIKYTTTSSADAATWCQQFVMTAFFLVYSRLLPDYMLNLVARILNLCTRKKLELPHDLLVLFQKNPEIQSTSPEMNELKRQFLGLSKHSDLIAKNGRFLTNRSNMMQGIFHYTRWSSHVHKTNNGIPHTEFGKGSKGRSDHSSTLVRR